MKQTYMEALIVRLAMCTGGSFSILDRRFKALPTENIHLDNGDDAPFWWQIYDQPWYPAESKIEALEDAISYAEEG